VAVATCVLDNREISVTVATSATNDDSSTVTSTSMPDTAVFVEVGRPIKCYLYRTVRLFFFVYIFYLSVTYTGPLLFKLTVTETVTDKS